jgi:hypothetical protein
MMIYDRDHGPVDSIEFISATLPGDPEYNSLGFRSKEPDDLDFDNYILFAGCSHAVGVGVEIDESFPAIVAKEFGCDYYNLSVGGGGIDAVEHNIMMWFLKYDKHPKYIVIEWPNWQRYIKNVEGQPNLCPAGAWTDEEFLVYADDAMYIKGDMAYQNLHNLTPVKIIDVQYGKITNFNVNSYMIWHCLDDIGTDGGHAGPKSHKATAEKIIEMLKTR